jgi:hypothetical protein
MNIQQYLSNVSALFNAGRSTEHSYRGDLQQLLTSLLKDVTVTNEPRRIECGAPDYILTRKDIPIGYIEAKDVGVKLGDKAHKEQFDRYKAALNNLIITDYLEFQFYKNGVPVDSVAIATIENGKIYAKPDSFDRFTALIENFASTISQTIKSPTTLAQMMAAKAKLMANVIKSALDEDDKAQSTTDLQGQMAAFKSILIHDMVSLLSQAMMSVVGHELPLGKSSEDQILRDRIFNLIAPYCLSTEDMEEVETFSRREMDVWLQSFTNTQKGVIFTSLLSNAKE